MTTYSRALILACLCCQAAVSSVYPLPYQAFDLVGNTQVIRAAHKDTLLDIARRYDVGQTEIILANPEVDRWLPGKNTPVTIPARYVLPPVPREGLILNLPEMRLYFYPKPGEGQTAEVQTYPVSIGRMDWATPLGSTTLVAKQKHPAWYPPASIRREHAEAGDPLPAVVPPGPDNPLGSYAMRLGIPGYLIHGTNKVFGVGMRVSHGCVRMLPEDIETLFPQVDIGTVVRIINQPAKVGWFGGHLYLELHPPLDEDEAGRRDLRNTVMALVDEALFRRPAELNSEALDRAIREQTGVPTAITALH